MTKIFLSVRQHDESERLLFLSCLK